MERMKPSFLSSPLLLAITLLPTAPVAQAQAPIARIINGQPTGEFGAVGIVGDIESGGYCTGTLLSPTHVLTAGHCAQFMEEPTDGTFEIDGQTYTTVGVNIHPGFDPITLENDLAILELSAPVPNVEPADIFRGVPLVGDELTIVGFGAGGTAEGGASGEFGEKRVGVTFIDDVNEQSIFWDFDDASESNTSPGDSGGPGFIEVAGEMLIASVTSGGTNQDAGLGDTAFNVRVDAYAAWIDAIVMVGDPTNDPPTSDDPPMGDPGDDEPPTGQTPDEDAPCPASPVKQAVRDILAEIVSFLASDSFVSLLQNLAAELRGSAAQQ